jgi:hypothetical protein
MHIPSDGAEAAAAVAIAAAGRTVTSDVPVNRNVIVRRNGGRVVSVWITEGTHLKQRRVIDGVLVKTSTNQNVESQKRRQP